MTRNVFLGTLFATAFAVSVTAQTGSQSDQQSSKNQQQVTVSGCLAGAEIDKAATGTAGTTGQATGSSRNESQFMLTNARITNRGSAGTSGTSGTGTAGATPGAAANDKFLLIGGNQQELKKYLNSQVEIRGTLQPRSDSDRGAGTAAGGTATGSATGQARSQSEMANVQRLRVTSVKQTAKTCTGGE